MLLLIVKVIKKEYTKINVYSFFIKSLNIYHQANKLPVKAERETRLSFTINNIALFLLLRKGENLRLMKPFHS